MSTYANVHDLADELLLQILDHLAPSDLLACRASCRKWYSVVRSTTTYSKSIHLTSLAPEAVSLFCDRFAASTSSGVEVRISIAQAQPNQYSNVWSFLSPNIHRICSLQLEVNTTQIAAALDALKFPAPELSFLLLRWLPTPQIPPPRVHPIPIPVDLFAGDAPKLVHFNFGGPFFFREVVPALNQTLALRVHDCIRAGQFMHPDSFPNLKALRLEQIPSSVAAHPPQLPPRLWSQLRSLYLKVDASWGMVNNPHSITPVLFKLPARGAELKEIMVSGDFGGLQVTDVFNTVTPLRGLLALRVMVEKIPSPSGWRLLVSYSEMGTGTEQDIEGLQPRVRYFEHPIVLDPNGSCLSATVVQLRTLLAPSLLPRVRMMAVSLRILPTLCVAAAGLKFPELQAIGVQDLEATPDIMSRGAPHAMLTLEAPNLTQTGVADLRFVDGEVDVRDREKLDQWVGYLGKLTRRKRKQLAVRPLPVNMFGWYR